MENLIIKKIKKIFKLMEEEERLQKKKLLAFSVAALFVSLILVTGVSLAASTSGINSYSGILAIPENSAQGIQIKQNGENVTIIWDKYGIPHINASTQEGAFFGHGYAQAVDGIELLTLNLLTATSRLSKTFGPYEYNNTWNPGYKFNAQFMDNSLSDGLLIALKIPVSSSDYLKINETMREVMIEPFAAGINYYLYQNWDTLPSWIKENAPVTGEHIASMGALTNFLFSNEVIFDWMIAEGTLNAMNWNVDLYLTMNQGGTGPHPLSSMDALDSDMGSNEWVVNNTLSSTGYPILGADPHLEWDGVTQWHMAHLMAPAQDTLPELNIYGVIFFGLPFIGIGHNEYLSWMSTVNQPDLGDVWIEKLSDDNTMYRYKGAWVPLRQETVNLPVKVPGIGVINQPVTTYYTHHGALLTINTTNHWALAVNYSSSQTVAGFEQFYLMNTAQNITQFKNALAMLGVAMFNYMVASVYNETFYVWNAMCPVRNDIYNWDYAVPGWVSSTDWGGFIPFVSLPQQEDPDEGWMQNCNIPAWNITTQPNAITIANDTWPFPLYLVNWNWQGMSNHTRGYNLFYILDDLAEGGADSITPAHFRGIAGNSSIIYIASDYIDKLPDDDPYALLDLALWVLKEWEDRGAYAWANETAMTIFKLWSQNYGVPANESQALSTLNATVKAMNATYGNISVPWGNVHFVVRGTTVQALNGTSGGYGCLNPHYGELIGTNWYCYGGESFEMVTTWIDGQVVSWSCLPYGNSNDPTSTHYDDMLTDWYSKDKLHPDFFYMSEILANNETIDEIPVLTLDETLYLLQLSYLEALASFFLLIGMGQIITGQQAASNLVLGGITAIILIMIVAAAVIISRRL